MAVVRLSDVIVAELFSPYMMLLTAQKLALIGSRAIMVDSELSTWLAGEGGTYNKRFYKDLDNDDENISSDDPDVKSTPSKIGTGQETQVRLSRNKSWSSMDLVSQLIDNDPMDAIAQRISNYWVMRMQAATIATMKGVFADNDAAPAASEHTRYDLTYDVSRDAFVKGVTSFSAEAFIDATATLGDRMGNLAMMAVHSTVYASMLNNDLIDFIPDSMSGDKISTFRGKAVIVDDDMPNTGGVFESWLFGEGAIRVGMSGAKVPTEVFRNPDAGNGSGQETLYSRVEWCIHPTGHAWQPAYATGGPSNAATSNNLAHAASWKRVFPERKQIKIARLKTREF